MDKRPNIVVIHADQMREDCLGFRGRRKGIYTPALDSIAYRGVHFENSYAACPLCIPARMSLLTGQTPQKLGIFENVGIPYVPFETTLPTEMGRGGYQTALVGRTMHTYPFSHPYGFEYYLPGDPSSDVKETKDPFFSYVRENTSKDDGGYYGNGTSNNSRLAAPFHLDDRFHQTAWATNRAIDFLEQRDESRPFMLFVGFYAPHSPFNAPEKYFNYYYDRDDLDEPCIADYDILPVSNGDLISPYIRLEGECLRRARAAYYGNITFLDHQVGRLLNKLNSFPNTYVIFTSDHGELLGDHYGLHKGKPWQGAVHIPFLIKGPGISGNRREECPVSWQDIAPTILNIAGLPVPDSMDGINLLPLLKGEENRTVREYIHGECIHTNPDKFGGYESQNRENNLMYEKGSHYITDGKMKYIWYVTSGREQLFDLSNDYYEKNDLSADPAYEEQLLLWRVRMICELEGRQEGYSDGKRLIPGKEPVRMHVNMRRLYDERRSEGYQMAYEAPKFIPDAKNYRNTLR